MIMDNTWDDYPKRSQSFCCATRNNKYSNKIYMVIPTDGSKWGIVPESDLWQAFRYSLKDVFGVAANITSFFKTFQKIAEFFDVVLVDDDYDKFKKEISVLEEKVKSLSPDTYKISKEQLVEHTFEFETNLRVKILDKIRNSNSLIDSLTEALSRKYFEVLNWNDTVKHLMTNQENRELWTDSTCLFVSQNDTNILEQELDIKIL